MVLREAVTIVIRHSGATACRLEIERREDDVMLTVADDGDGSAMIEGWGLTGMRSRVAAAGGELSVLGGRDGTRISASMKDAES